MASFSSIFTSTLPGLAGCARTISAAARSAARSTASWYHSCWLGLAPCALKAAAPQVPEEHGAPPLRGGRDAARGVTTGLQGVGER